MAEARGKYKIDRHVPYYSKKQLVNAGDSKTEYIQMDPAKGLGVVGKSGWIVNDGPGDLTVIIHDGVYISDPVDIYAGEGFGIEHADNIWVKEITMTSVTLGTTYRLYLTRGETPVTEMEDE